MDLQARLSHAVNQVDKLMEKFPEDFPSASSLGLLYGHKPNKEWTAGFFTGLVWLAYEWTRDEKYRIFAQKHTESFRERLDREVSVDFHDLGFLYTLSCVADYKLTGSSFAKETAVMAAERLAARFQSKGGFIQAWGGLDDPEEYRLIIDCFMNLPLLFWASEATGVSYFAEAAYKHYHTAVNTVIRKDYTTCHTFFFDKETGSLKREATNQGYSDESCWSRGQAWAIYGIPLFLKYCPKETQEEKKRFFKVLQVFETLLPEDGIPSWDFYAGEDAGLKDSSAAAIAVCGMQAMLSLYGSGGEFKKVASLKERMLRSLLESCDTFAFSKPCDGLLLHGMHHWPRKQGVDESVLWGDYFYMEALVRESLCWKSYW